MQIGFNGVRKRLRHVPAITAIHRIAAVKLTAQQSLETAERPDKTGSRTFPGFPAGCES